MRDDVALDWTFLDEQGTFRLPNPHRTSYLYFPLVNEAGMMSAISPTGNGDVKAGQNAFLTLPISAEDLHNTRSARNFWVTVSDRLRSPWSATGNSAYQVARSFDDAENPVDSPSSEKVTLEAGFLWHRVTRENRLLGLKAEVTNFIPSSQDQVELMAVRLTNTGQDLLHLTPTAAIPIFGRSADNLRDHRHVSSLLHRTVCHRYGVLVRPTLSFDERGHLPNDTTYAVLGAGDDGQAPIGFFPTVEDFIGEGGTLDWPEAVVRSIPPSHHAGDQVDGYEALGGLGFSPVVLSPGQSKNYVLILGILNGEGNPDSLLATYGDRAKFDAWLERTKAHWQRCLDTVGFRSSDNRYDRWLRWVSLQPELRRLFGNSFLPYHDYGRGGRGWRDLWQDALSLLIMQCADVGDSLVSYFAGVRFDGSNATIIGSSRQGDFKADRNDIPRVWMDHGAWPLLTVRLYIDQTGDLGILLRKQTYFKDHLTHRCQQLDEAWEAEQGTSLCTRLGEPYRGAVLEHLLVQHLTAFFHVGEHNIICLEGADWNDGLDMASQRGESAAFSALYAWNLSQLSDLVRALERLGVTEVELAAELALLLDTMDPSLPPDAGSAAGPVDYSSVAAKRQRLAAYFDRVATSVSGETIQVALDDLARDLSVKADWLCRHLRTQEWIQNAEGHGWFNGYYDNQGRRVEGDHLLGVRMTLVGQVFALMGDIATDDQAQAIAAAVDRYLWDEAVGGPRLNTDFGEVLLSLGRAFGFAFGHKENGAMFSHMAVMYANALYRRGLVAAGWRVLESIYRKSQDFATSRMYPGIPEYFSARGRGMYPFLTGSASWYLLTMVTEVFGVKGVLGDLRLAPKLVPSQFDLSGRARITTLFAGRSFEVTYHNPEGLDYGSYRIGSVAVDGRSAATISRLLELGDITIPRDVITSLAPGEPHRIDVELLPTEQAS